MAVKFLMAEEILDAANSICPDDGGSAGGGRGRGCGGGGGGEGGGAKFTHAHMMTTCRRRPIVAIATEL